MRPDIFVASEFLAQEPLRAAKAAMMRERRAYTVLFGKPAEDRSPDELSAGAELIQHAAWFESCFAPYRSRVTSAHEQAFDLGRAAGVVTYEPVSDGAQVLCTKDRTVDAFFVIISGAVHVSGDPLVAPHERAEGQWFGVEALVPPKEDAPAQTAAGHVRLAAGSGKLTLLKISRGGHLAAMGLQRQRQYRAYADVLGRLPMLSHYTCAQRTKLANSFSHVAFKTDEIVVHNAAHDSNLYVLLKGAVEVRKRMRVGPAEEYDLELKVLDEGDLFGGDRFNSGLQLFQDLSFVAVQAIECLQLSTDHRLLDARARTLIVEDFTWVPDHDQLMRAFSGQEQWEQIKARAIKHQFKASLSHQVDTVPDFAHSISQQTFTRTSRYLPSGNFVGFGRDGRHQAETPSQFELRKSAVEKETQRWEARLSQSAGGRRRVGGGRRVSSVPLAMTRYEAMALAETKQQISVNGGTMSDAELSNMISVSSGRPSRGTKPGRPPKPVTPNDFGAPWTVAAAAQKLAPLTAASVSGLMLDDGESWHRGIGGKSRVGTPDSMAISDDSLLMDSDAVFGDAVVGGDASTAVSVNEMWPVVDATSTRSASAAAERGWRRRRSAGVESWGVQALAAGGWGHSTPDHGGRNGRAVSVGLGVAVDDTAPRVSEGFDRMVVQRLRETQVQYAMKAKQARSSQFYPSLPVLIADVVDASALSDCGPELSEILDDIFTKFRELADHYGAHALWGPGNRFVALGGVQGSTESSCIGSSEEEAIGQESFRSGVGGVKWSERSFEATTSFLEGLHERQAAEQSRARTFDSAFDDSMGAPKPKNLALDQLVQLAFGLQRCAMHANDETVGHPCKWPEVGRLQVKIGIAVGPAVVGFFGLERPFLYSVSGWTVDEARRLERAAKPGAIILDVTAHRLVGSVYHCEPLAARDARRSGPSEGAQWDYELKSSEKGVESKGKARYCRGSTGVTPGGTDGTIKTAAATEVTTQRHRRHKQQINKDTESGVRSSRSLSKRPGLRLRPSNYAMTTPLREQMRAGKLKPARLQRNQRPRQLAEKSTVERSNYWAAARCAPQLSVGSETVDFVTERVAKSVSAYL